MNDNKLVYVVTLILLDAGKIMTCSNSVYPSKDEARNSVQAFANRWGMDKDTNFPSYNDEMSGKSCKSPNDTPLLEHPTREFFVSYDTCQVDPDELEDAVRDYTVELRVVRTHEIMVNVETESQADAEELARENCQNGEYEEMLDCADDEDIYINDCYES